MLLSSIFIALGAIFGYILARTLVERRQTFNGVATSNNYGKQSNIICGPKSAGEFKPLSNMLSIRFIHLSRRLLDKLGYFGAAAVDISPDISKGPCNGKIDLGLW